VRTLLFWTLLFWLVIVPALSVLAFPVGVLIGFFVGCATAPAPRAGRRGVALPTAAEMEAARLAIETYRKHRVPMAN
jgi:hypothetical protein